MKFRDFLRLKWAVIKMTIGDIGWFLRQDWKATRLGFIELLGLLVDALTVHLAFSLAGHPQPWGVVIIVQLLFLSLVLKAGVFDAREFYENTLKNRVVLVLFMWWASCGT